MSEPVLASAERRRRARLLGLVLPGGGQLVHGDVLAAIGVLLGVVFFVLTCSLELVVHNRTGYPAPLVLLREVGALKPPLTVVPDAPVALIFALVLHFGAAIMAGSARFGGPPCQGDAEA